MGWSDYTARPAVEKIFKRAGKKCRLSWVSATYPQVRIQYEGRITFTVANEILALFPDFVYVEFVPDTKFGEEKKIA